MADGPKNPGARRAAALLLGLGPEMAVQVFGQLGEADVRRIALGAKELRRNATNSVPEALGAFVSAMDRVGGDAAAGDDMLREVATRALGVEIATRAFDGVMPAPPADEALGPVALADPEALAMVLSREQPQTVAMVLSAMTPDRAAAVMEFLPSEQRPSIVRRMAVVDAVSPEVLREVRQALTAELQTLMAEGMRKVDGRSAALEILRRSTGAQQSEVLTAIEKDEPSLAAELRTKLFTFDDLAHLTDRDIQQLAKEVDMNQLTLALKGGSSGVKDKFMKNMSARAAQLLGDDLAALGPVKLSAVEAAQVMLATTAVQLAEKGRITLVRPTDKML